MYCRPVCPARVAYQSHRRFFNSAAAAEHAGFRPCLRCRPELAPGLAVVDAVARLAHLAAHRIGAGGLNGRSVADLAGEFGVSERHLRRALEREIGVSPSELAQTHRLLLAKRLLVDSGLSVTQIAFASGFQSLRRFNAAFREQYRMAPSALRRAQTRRASPASPGEEPLRLTLAYRAPFFWDALLGMLGHEAIPGVEVIEGPRYGRTVRLDDRTGHFFTEDATPRTRAPGLPADTHLTVDVSASLLPALMPLIARLRRLFDLDMEPTVVDAHLAQGGLGALVATRPGVRIPGAFDGFEIAVRTLVPGALLGRLVAALGDPIETGIPGLTHLTPTATRIAGAGPAKLEALGVPSRRARSLGLIAHRVAQGLLRLVPGADLAATRRALLEIDGIGERQATAILMRTLYWPDAFPAGDRALQRAAGVTSTSALLARAERWRPWRAYAAVHLQLQVTESNCK